MSDDAVMSISEAAAVTQQFARFLKGLERLREAAQALAGAEQMVSERKIAAGKLGEEIAALTTERDSIRGDIEKFKASAVAYANDVKAAAEAAAEALRAAAKSDVASAQELKTKAEQAVAQAQADRAAIIADAKAAASELAGFKQRIEDAKAEALRRFG